MVNAWMRVRLLQLILGGFFISTSFVSIAATRTFIPSADASLLEVSPSNSMGGFRGMNSGTTQNGPRTRALLRFDLSVLPTNTVIQSAQLTVQVTQQPVDGYDFTVFGLHRMFRPWGEGTNVPVQFPGQGVAAAAGDATWLHAFFPTNAWSVPGGLAGVDFSPAQSSFETIYDVANSPYIFPSTPELVDDVTLWISHPSTNFGWMLLCGDEFARFTARRYGTREDANNFPVLELKYLVPPVLQISRTNAHQVEIRFTAWAGHTYTIQSRASAKSGTWKTLKTIPAAPTNYTAVVLDYALNDFHYAPYRSYRQRYYRAIAQ
jgi:hypothetical protein